MHSELIFVQGAVGKLSTILQIPDMEPNEKCPLVILMHGLMMTKECDLIKMIASKLQEKGIASIRFDFEGHGQSGGELEEMTVPKEIIDAMRIFEYALSLDYIENISLLGHSQGGVVAGMLAGELGTENIKSLVLMAPAAILKDGALSGDTLGLHFDPHKIPKFISYEEYRIGREYFETAQKLPIYETTAHFKGPACIIQGKADEVVDPKYSERYHEVLKKSVIHLLENENHDFQHNMQQAADIAVDFLTDITKTETSQDNEVEK